MWWQMVAANCIYTFFRLNFTLPFPAAANRPIQHARPFRLELIGQVAVAFVEWYLDLKGNDTNTAPERIVGFADPRTVVSGEP